MYFNLRKIISFLYKNNIICFIDLHEAAFFNKYYMKVFILESYNYYMISSRGEVCSVAYGQKVIKIMNTYFIWA